MPNPELACRLLEAAWELQRPEGKSAEETLDGLGEQDRAMWLRVADAAEAWFKDNGGTRCLQCGELIHNFTSHVCGAMIP